MKKSLFLLPLLWFLAAPGVHAGEEGVGDKVGRTVKKGGAAAEEGIEKGASAANKGVVKAFDVVNEKVFKKADRWIQGKVNRPGSGGNPPAEKK